MEQFWHEVLTFCQTTTQKLGNYLVAYVGQISPTQKDDGSLVTQADHWTDQTIRAAIAAEFPKHGVLTEETTHIFPETDWCWIIDPIDGTTNFTRGIPIWGISLGLLYRGTPVFGFVHFPQLQQSFHGYWYGETGITGPKGSYSNGVKIHTDSNQPSKSHLFNLCTRSTTILRQPFPCKIRMIGVASYNISLVACGAALGGVEATPKIWDIAAVWVILQGAGGVFVSLNDDPIFPLKIGHDYGEKPFPCLVVSQPELVPFFKPLVQGTIS
ncbi:MAG: inositol monophosphatase family protein [cyanobacterium endosymbiont of Rhopalodia sterrenbergii]